MNEQWYARSVLFVEDIDRTLDFYVRRLGFTQNWRFEEAGRAFVAQADPDAAEVPRTMVTQ